MSGRASTRSSFSLTAYSRSRTSSSAAKPVQPGLKMRSNRARSRRLRARFDRIFNPGCTGFAALDEVLDRLYAVKEKLLRVLARPDIPLHTNRSEERRVGKECRSRWSPYH